MDKEDLEVFVLTDENGQEHHFILLAEIQDNNKKYWICEEIMVDDEGRIEEFGEVYPFLLKEDENGGLFVDSIESEEEFERVSKAWNELLEKDENLRAMFSPDDYEHEHDEEHHHDHDHEDE